MSRCLILTASLLVATVWPAVASAQLANLSNTTFADLLVGQDDDDFVNVFDGNFSDTGAPVSISGGASFGDFESGEGGVLAISGSASASAGFGRLRAAASATLTENTVTGDEEPLINDDGSENEFGVPDSVGFNANAIFRDRLQYGGTATNYESTYFFRLTGNISGTNGFAFVTVKHGDNPLQTFFFNEPGTYDQILVSEKFTHVNGPQFIEVSLQTSIDFFAEFDPEGASGSVAFGSTLELVGIELRDADTGLLANDVVITTETGEGGSIAIVPEPGTAMLAAIGGLMLLGRRRRA